MTAPAPVQRFFTFMPWHAWTSGRWRLDTLSRHIGALPVGSVRAGPRLMHVVRDADAVGRVLLDNAANYQKQSESYDELRPLLGDGLFLTEGPAWKRQRRLAQPAFHHKRLVALAGTMTDATAELLARWERFADSGEVVDVADEMMRLTLTVVGRALLSADLGAIAADIGKNLTFVLGETDRRALAPLPLPSWLPLPRNFRYRRAVESLDRHVDALVHARRVASEAGATAPDDLLSMLLHARDEENGEGMTDRELRDQVKTLLLAGHETTASALAWTWALLGENPAIEERLHGELERALGGRTPTFGDLPSLGYASRVVQEAMRLYPPIWIIERRAIEDDALAGYLIPAGGNVTVITYLVHRNPAYWPEPDRFDPERFLPEREKERPRFAYLPFGAGPRICIGNAFAMMEAQLIVAMVAQRFRVVVEPAHPVEPRLAITLRTGGVRARLVRRGK